MDTSNDLIVIHTADWHLGKNRKYDDHLDQQSLMLFAIVSQLEQTLKDNPSAHVWFVLAGDVFDRNEDTRRGEFVLFLTGFITPLLNLIRTYKNLKVYIIDGNHDRQPNVDEPSVLSPLAPIFGKAFRIAIAEPKYFEDTGFLALPYGGYSAVEMREICKQYDPRFVAAHECLSRMQTDTGWSPPRDQDHYIEINNVLPDFPKIQGIFLGDIHRCQSLDDGKLCWYSGSPITLDHGHRPPKGLLHHYYKNTNGVFMKIVEQTDLKPLVAEGLRQHYQLGVIANVEDIPWERVLQAKDSYLDLVVSPEVHKEIADKIPDFFTNPRVSATFERDKDKSIKKDSSVMDDQIDQSYYGKAIREWSGLNLPHLTDSTKDEFVGRAEKLFEGRG